MIPNAIPAFMAFGLWGVLVGQVNLAVAMVFSISLGILVDDTVHFITKYRYARNIKNFSPEESIHYAFANVGVALVITTLVLAIGFSVLAVSNFNLNSMAGTLTAMTIVIDLNIQNHIAHVVLSRAEKMNALDDKMFEAILMVGEELRKDKTVRVVVVSGAGGNFSAGLDKSNFSSMLEKKGVVLNDDEPPMLLADRTHGISNSVQAVVWMWRELPMPVIAAVDGFVLGGGLQIALGADFRYATADAKFSILEMRWGIVPDMGSTQIMRHMIRDDVIRELTYTARIFSALEHALKLAEAITLKNPDAVRASKKIIENSYYQTAAEGLLMESVEQDKIMGTPNQIEAVMAELQKRKPNFKD